MKDKFRLIQFNRQRRLLSLITVTTAMLIWSLTAQAAPGDLDSTFGTGGQVSAGFDIRKIIVQNDGKIIAVGAVVINSNYSAVIKRFHPNGQLDSSFGNGSQPDTLSMLFFFDVVLQNDGKIVAVGLDGTFPRFGAVRYNPNGTLDTGFGSGGIVRPPLNFAGEALTVAVQGDGKILVGGLNRIAKNGNALLFRFNPNGSLDTTFASNGLFQVGGANGVNTSDIVVRPDGKIIVILAGRIYRLNPNGSIDSTFGSNGISRPGIFSQDFVLQPDGKIILAGTFFNDNGTPADFAVARINENGTIDSSFGINGIVKTVIGNIDSRANDVEIQKNGKIVAVGYSISNIGNSDSTVVRYTPNGVLDAGFGNNGVIVQASADADRTEAVAIQQDGKILVGGFQGNSTLVRYLGDAVNSYPRFDFDGDARADVSVFRPSNGYWFLLNSSIGYRAVPFGLSQDQLAAADFDGDRKTDIAVFRASNGEWTVLNSSNNTYRVLNFGTAGDLARPGDFDGDGKADVCVFRPSNGFWYWLNSSDGHFRFAQFGQNGDAPLIADYDGDGKSDIAIYRPSNGTWYWIGSSDGRFSVLQFGAATDKPVPTDFDGDGKTDLAVFRPSNGLWYLLQSQTGFTSIQFGLGTDTPVAADYDGDGKADLAVIRNGIWYLNRTTEGLVGTQFGTATDLPIPNAFVR